jgi:ABC-type thiamin/hydroxymethylpyrimidine transport system permease subunit
MNKKQLTSGGVAMAAAMIAAWGIKQAGVEVPTEIVAAMATVIGYAGKQLGDE